MRALTKSDLSGIGSASLQGAAEDVVDAGLINVGTGLRVGTRTALFGPLTAGQDLDILGGAGPLNGVAVRPQAAVPIGPGTGGGTPLQQVGAYNQQQWAGFERLTEYQASTTQGLTHADLADAATALGKGDVVTAAKNVADAAAINVGTGLQIGTRAAAFVPGPSVRTSTSSAAAATSWGWWPSLPSSSHTAAIKLAAWRNLMTRKRPDMPRAARCWWSTSVRSMRS